MKKSLLLLSALSTLMITAGVQKPEVKSVEYKKIILKNQWLSVELLPESMGRIDRITYIPENYSILFPRHMVKTDHGTLLKNLKGNEFGSCDTFAHRDMRPRENKMSVEQPAENTVIFTAKNYGGEPINLTRKIVLAENGTKISVTSRLEWVGKDNTTVTPRWDFFLNGGDPLPKRRNMFIPLVRMKDKEGKYDSLVRWQQRLVTPSDNFLAVAIPPKKLSFALIVDPESFGTEGKFYTLSSGYNSRWYWWMAFILSPQKMSKGDVREYSFDAAVFPNFTDLKEICGDIAMRCYVTRSTNPWILGVVLSPASSTEAGEIQLALTSEDGKKFERTIKLPALTAGKQRNVSWTLSGVPAGKYRISGKISGKGEFSFPEPVIQIK